MLIVILLIILGVHASYSLSVIKSNGNKLYEQGVIPTNQLVKLSKYTENTRVQMLQSVNSHDPYYTTFAEDNLVEIERLIMEYDSNVLTPEEQKKFNQFKQHWTGFASRVEKNIAFIHQGNFVEAAKGLELGREPFMESSHILLDLMEMNEQKANALRVQSNQTYEDTQFVFKLVIIASIVLAIGIGFVVGKIITDPISTVAKYANLLAQGDLSVPKLKVKNRDEIGHLVRAFNNMINHLKLSKDVMLARKIQRSFLPAEIDNEYIKVKTIHKPSNQYISGDLFEYIWDKNSRTLSGYIIDVMGHGVATALQTSTLRVLFMQAAEKNLPLNEQLAWVNKKAIDSFTDDTFAAAICFQMDLNNKVLTFASGGINYFITTHTEEKIVKVPGTYLGLIDDMDFQEHQISIKDGDNIYFVSDGIFDELDQTDIEKVFNFDQTYLSLEMLTNRNLRDDATAVCIHIKENIYHQAV